MFYKWPFKWNFKWIKGAGTRAKAVKLGFYRWPLKDLLKTHARLGTLGEFRGLGRGDGVTILHSGTDIAEKGHQLKVFSPDTGLVRRGTPATGGTANPSAGTNTIRIGHFAFNHIRTIFSKPHSVYHGPHNKRLYIHKDLPIYVVQEGTKFYVPKKGISNPKRDADFRPKDFPRQMPVSGLKITYRRLGSDSYENATLWPQYVPIGKSVGPDDLHCIYYESDDGPYLDISNIANCLEIWQNYNNKKIPNAKNLMLYAQDGDTFILNFNRRRRYGKIPPGGATLKVMAGSPFNSVCGIYQLEYRIWGEPPVDTTRLNMWKFHKPPPDADAFIIVDKHLSSFVSPYKKFTYYVFTKSRNEDINNGHHWEVEDTATWPDGHYFISIWLKNIKESKGVGIDPDVNEVKYQAKLNLDTVIDPTLGECRTIYVTKRFKKVKI